MTAESSEPLDPANERWAISAAYASRPDSDCGGFFNLHLQVAMLAPGEAIK
jgi:hypothetical protein